LISIIQRHSWWKSIFLLPVYEVGILFKLRTARSIVQWNSYFLLNDSGGLVILRPPLPLTLPPAPPDPRSCAPLSFAGDRDLVERSEFTLINTLSLNSSSSSVISQCLRFSPRVGSRVGDSEEDLSEPAGELRFC